MNTINALTILAHTLLYTAFGGTLYHVINKQEKLEHMLVDAYYNRPTHTHIDTTAPVVSVAPTVPDEDRQLWRAVQERVQDTVVQVFVQIAAVDLLEPYKTPVQGTATGSGFFINDEGYLITNAHVVDQAKSVWIQIPSLGKRILDVDVVGVAPYPRDIALCKVKEEDLEYIKQELGSVPYLRLGDSDAMRRADEVLALGYPLGQQSLKSTTGVISGRESNRIQISAPINPGSSGGPLLNLHGEVIGINTSGVVQAQNVGYIIPVNNLKVVLDDLFTTKLLRKPFLGVLFNNASKELTEFLGNPQPGGCYVVEVIKNSTLCKAGVEKGDMIYAINGNPVDMYGDMVVPWHNDKISIIDYVSRLHIGKPVELDIYRKGVHKKLSAVFSQGSLPAIRKIYPGYEDIDYEVFGGMVVMQLTLDHVQMLSKVAPGLRRYAEAKNQESPVLVVTHIFPTSHLYRSRTLMVGATLTEVNGIPVTTLQEFRDALKQADGKNLTIRASDHYAQVTDNVFVVLPWQKILEQEMVLARDFKYIPSETAQSLLQQLAFAQGAQAKPLHVGVMS